MSAQIVCWNFLLLIFEWDERYQELIFIQNTSEREETEDDRTDTVKLYFIIFSFKYSTRICAICFRDQILSSPSKIKKRSFLTSE